jgi:hypothetical protein
MKTSLSFLLVVLCGAGLAPHNSFAQTDGGAKLEATILDYTGSSNTKHWTVVWVTTASGTFVKSLRKQGPSWTTTHWDSHCSAWNTARGGSASGSQALDGYSSATAQDYTGTNSPIYLTWNCRDAGNNLMPDGNYRFWIQYAEDAGQGPYTTSGLLWTKGTAGGTNTYANQGANFTNLKVTWTPAASPPRITEVRLSGNDLVLSGNGPANGVYSVLASANPAALPLEWAAISTNHFDGAGKFIVTNTINPSVPRNFYRLRVP